MIPYTSIGPVRGGTLVLHLCGGNTDGYPQLWRRATSSSCGQLLSHEAFALRVLNQSSASPTVLITGSGPAGVLYGAWALRRLTRLHTPLTTASIYRLESPATTVRCINLWSQWRGFPYDAWMAMPAGRADSIFSWADLRPGGNTTKITAWVRLLSSAGINAIAPQDVKSGSFPRTLLLCLGPGESHSACPDPQGRRRRL